MKCRDSILTKTMILALPLARMAGKLFPLSTLSFLNDLAAATISLPREATRHKRQANLAPISPVEDRFTPHGPPLNWTALGDSYTASPGTGADYDRDKACRRNVGSYAIQLENNFPFTEANYVDFLACSGYKSPDTLKETIPNIQQDEADFMVMTLGGNDIGFSSIAIDCLVRPGLIFDRPCQDTLSRAQRDIADVSFENNIHAVYDAVFNKMKDDYHYQLYHIFYSRFFNDQTDWCDYQTFSTPIAGPKLLKIRRQRLNQLADLLNGRLEEIANNYIQKKKGRPSWNPGSRLITINPEKIPNPSGTGTYAIFDGHRFCEPGATQLENSNVWFFGTVDQDNTLNSEGPEVVPPSIIQRREEFDVLDNPKVNDTLQDLPEFVVRSFHPKTLGMNATAQALQQILQKNRPAER